MGWPPAALKGVERVISILRDELERAMALNGKTVDCGNRCVGPVARTKHGGKENSAFACGGSVSRMEQHKIAILLHEEFEMWRPPPWFLEKLRAEFPQTEVVYSAKKRDDEQALRDADVMIGWSLQPEQLRAAKSLRWIYSIIAAVDQFLYPELISSEIALTNAGRVHGPVVAEHAIAMLLALAKRLPSAVRYQQRRKWAMEAIWKEQPRPREVRGASLVVVGLGSIGAEVASVAAALKMHVIGVREHPERGTEGAHEVVGYDALDNAIRKG